MCPLSPIRWQLGKWAQTEIKVHFEMFATLMLQTFTIISGNRCQEFNFFSVKAEPLFIRGPLLNPTINPTYSLSKKSNPFFLTLYSCLQLQYLGFSSLKNGFFIQ